MSLQLVQKLQLFGKGLVISRSSGSLCNSSLQYFKIGENQLQIDRLDVTDRINAAVHMDDVGILKAAHHMNDGVHLTDVGQELVSQAFSFGCTLYETGDIHKLNDGRRYLLGIVEVSQELQSFIRYCHNAHVRVDGTEGIVG